MSAAHLLDELRTLGVRVWPDAGALRFKAPAGAMTPELTARLKVAKPDLLAILAVDALANDDTDAGPDLPLLAAVQEFEALIERLCDLSRYDDDTRRRMHTARCHMSPESLCNDLPRMRALVDRSAKPF